MLGKALGKRENVLTPVSKTAAGGDTSPVVQSMVVPQAARETYTPPPFAKPARPATYTSTNNSASMAAFQGQVDAQGRTQNPLLAAKEAKLSPDIPDPNTRYDTPPVTALKVNKVDAIHNGDLLYVRDKGAKSDDNTRYRLAKAIEDPHKANGEFRIEYIYSNNGTEPERTEIQVDRVKRVSGQKAPKPAPEPPKGGAYKSRKYRKLLNKKSRRSNNKTNNKKITKKRRNMRGGFIANYKTPSSSKGKKTKKVQKSSSSGSSKTTTSSKR
jgi:hypothetical protein